MSSFFYYDPSVDFDRLFNEAFDTRFSPSNERSLQRRGNLYRDQGIQPATRPKMDIHEDVGTNTVTAVLELPGLAKENVNIEVHNGRLTISGETKSSAERGDSGYAVRERSFGKFSRTINLPQGIKDNEIKASMEHGILTVTFPKTTPEMAPKRVTIS
ncbi:hypothetical protein AMATHDRAFT_148491 [Amanita thiersii Skay4041]|uniref:SHSP domain-containing protein n=1 Tax=Amanita thiersii Skay4041 TaxID=703135 RepID=A0A2A9NIC5_9AGAR|nr:hypothetical protein AMATHDRAFT_148491 [Amanita thiersii Skay4041]